MRRLVIRERLGNALGSVSEQIQRMTAAYDLSLKVTGPNQFNASLGSRILDLRFQRAKMQGALTADADFDMELSQQLVNSNWQADTVGKMKAAAVFEY